MACNEPMTFYDFRLKLTKLCAHIEDESCSIRKILRAAFLFSRRAPDDLSAMIWIEFSLAEWVWENLIVHFSASVDSTAALSHLLWYMGVRACVCLVYVPLCAHKIEINCYDDDAYFEWTQDTNYAICLKRTQSERVRATREIIMLWRQICPVRLESQLCWF